MHLLLGTARRLPRSRRELPAGFGRDDDVGAPVGRVGAPYDEAARLQVVDQARPPGSDRAAGTRRARAGTDERSSVVRSSTEYDRALRPCSARAALPAASEIALERASRKLRSSLKADARSAGFEAMASADFGMGAMLADSIDKGND